MNSCETRKHKTVEKKFSYCCLVLNRRILSFYFKHKESNGQGQRSANCLTCGTHMKLSDSIRRHTATNNVSKNTKNAKNDRDLFLCVKEKFNSKPTKFTKICGKPAENLYDDLFFEITSKSVEILGLPDWRRFLLGGRSLQDSQNVVVQQEDGAKLHFFIWQGVNERKEVKNPWFIIF